MEGSYGVVNIVNNKAIKSIPITCLGWIGEYNSYGIINDICSVHLPNADIDADDSHVKFKMPIYKTISVRDFIDCKYDIDKLMVDISKALNMLHAHGMIHRDVKLANVMYDSTHDSFVLVDFNHSILACNKIKKYESHVVTYTHRAPNIYRKKEKYTNTIDRWSLGIMIMEIICNNNSLYNNEDDYKQLYTRNTKQYIKNHIMKFMNNYCIESMHRYKPIVMTLLFENNIQSVIKSSIVSNIKIADWISDENKQLIMNNVYMVYQCLRKSILLLSNENIICSLLFDLLNLKYVKYSEILLTIISLIIYVEYSTYDNIHITLDDISTDFYKELHKLNIVIKRHYIVVHLFNLLSICKKKYNILLMSRKYL